MKLFGKKEKLENKENFTLQESLKENEVPPKIPNKLKLNITKKSLKSLILSFFVFLVAAILIIANFSKVNKNIVSGDSEFLRSLTYEEFEDGEEVVENTDGAVEFSAFFLRDLNGDGYAEKLKGTCKELGKEDKLYMELIVKTEGYLKDGKIEIDGKNFYLQTALPEDQELNGNYIGNNTREINFKQITNGSQKMIMGLVRSGDYTYSSGKTSAIGNNVNDLSRNDNKIILTGTYVNGAGEEVEIRKEIDLSVDWYGIAGASISANYYGNSLVYTDIESRIDEENSEFRANFTVYTKETKELLKVSKNYVEGTIPNLSGYAPTEVRCKTSNVDFNYDVVTQKFTIIRNAETDENGNIISSVSRNNSYEIEVIYPLAAYQEIGEETVTIKIPVKTYYEGYNNPNQEFENPYKSNVANTLLTSTYKKYIPPEIVHSSSYGITVGKYLYSPSYRYVISKQKPIRIYNGISEEEKDDLYTVRWDAYVGTNESLDTLTMKETENGQEQAVDEFIKVDGVQESMENITTNVGIYFSGATSLLGEEGFIKVYDDETDNLLVTFTKDNWDKYNASNPYRYETGVKHIRIETSTVNKEQNFSVYNLKELDDEYITENYTKEEFDNLKYIKSNLVVYLGNRNVSKINHQANYEAPYSIAEISLSKDILSTQITEKNELIYVQAKYDASNNQVGWKDGSFLVKVPEDILEIQINDISISNNTVNITSYEYFKNENGKFIKINTKNTNEIGQAYTITIDCDITPDPRIGSKGVTFELYASNNEGCDYYYKAEDIYDVNDNLNTAEYVNKTSTNINLVSPNTLLTNQTASNYDSKGSVAVSPEVADVKPIYAIVDQEENTADIQVYLKNNYSNTISEMVIVGKIPFEGNTYELSNKNLNSTFTAKMKNTGLEIPEELEGIVTVYYSENEDPSRYLNDSSNNWKLAEDVTNWNSITTYLIDFGNYVMPEGKELTFNYTISIPNGLEFNKESFSHHGVYFALDTEEGKYRTQTEPNKLGFRIAEKYNLELSKFQLGKTNLVPGATYKISELDEEESEVSSKTGVTLSNRNLTVNNLYAEKVYSVQEIKSPEDYELNENTVKFIGHVDEDGTLTIEKLEGITKDDIEVIKNEGEDYKTELELEDEAKARLKITKIDSQTGESIRGVKFKLTGAGLPEKGKILTTNANGEINGKGLKIGEEYTLEEVKADGYYLASPLVFKIINNEGTYSFELVEDEENEEENNIVESDVTEENNLPVLNLTLENEKIPTYDLELVKVKRVINSVETEGEENLEEVTYLPGAKFKLYKDGKELGKYETDENGILTITNLREYVEGKEEQEKGEYVLKEVLAPEGYAKVKDIKFKVEEKEGNLEFIQELQEGQNASSFTCDGNKVTITVEDSPSFKLIKKDGETGEALSGVKFAIYNVDNGNVPASNSKGEIIGTKEIINGKEFYTVTTDENGEITADLPEGYYKAVEVEADEKYDITNSIHYFGIGGSSEGEKTYKAEWAKAVGGSDSDEINTLIETADGGYIIGGYFYSNSVDLGNGILLTNQGENNTFDGMIIKYDSEGNAEWGKVIGGTKDDLIKSVHETSDGGYIVGGYFKSNTIDLENGILLTNQGNNSSDGMIIKYNMDGEYEWGKSIGGTGEDYINSVAETSDGGYICRRIF